MTKLRVGRGGARLGAVTVAIAALAASLLVAACSSGGGAASPTANTNALAASAAVPAAVETVAGAGTSSGAGGAGGGDVAPGVACSKLTLTEIGAALGVTVGRGEPVNDGKMCLWGDDNTGRSASIALETGSTFAETCSVGGTVPVSGVADGACYLEGGTLGTSLHFTKGGLHYSIGMTMPGGTMQAIEAAEKALALDALPRL